MRIPSTLLLAVLLSTTAGFCQSIEARFQRLEKDLIYPVMSSHVLMGVMPVKDAALRYSPEQRHQVGIDLTMPLSDSSKASFGVTEIGRTFNLHVANGAPKEKVEMVVIVHGGAISTFFTNERYAKRYGIDNPNIPVIRELSRNGVKFYVCGQSLALLNLPADALVPELKPSLSAKTAITAYLANGFTFLYLDNN